MLASSLPALEEDVGFPIFIRGGRNGVFPTSPSDLAPVEIIGRTGRIIEHVDRALEAKLEEFQISRASFDVLVALRRNGKPYQLTQRELMRSPLPYLRKHESQDRLSGEARFCGAETGYRRSAIVFVKLTRKGIALLEVLIPEHFEVMWMKLNLSLQVRPYSLLGAIGRLLGNHYAGAPRSEFVDT